MKSASTHEKCINTILKGFTLFLRITVWILITRAELTAIFWVATSVFTIVTYCHICCANIPTYNIMNEYNINEYDRFVRRISGLTSVKQIMIKIKGLLVDAWRSCPGEQTAHLGLFRFRLDRRIIKVMSFKQTMERQIQIILVNGIWFQTVWTTWLKV